MEEKEGVVEVYSPQVLGIDLGTSNSSVSVYVKGQNITLPIDGSSLSIPSVVRFEDRKLNSIIVGKNAKSCLLIKPNEVFGSVKSLMRNNDWEQDANLKEKHTFDVGIITPTQIAAEILKEIKNAAERIVLQDRRFIPGSFNKTCISVPANSSPIYKKNVMLAAEIAGFGVRDDGGNIIKDKDGNIEGVVLIDEPTAASLAYGMLNGFFTEEASRNQNILVYDFGGGTFDVTLLNIISEKGRMMPRFTVKGTKGIAQLGGDTIDYEIVKFLVPRLIEQTGIDIFDLTRDQKATSPKELRVAQSKLKEEAENVKITFSRGVNKAEISIPNLFTDGEGVTHSFETNIEKKEFLELIDPLLEQSIECVNETLREANMDIDDINRIVLVGGSCKGPWIKERILNKFGKEPYTAPNVDTIVSQGNAFYGAQQVNAIVCPNCGVELDHKSSEDKPCSCGFIGTFIDAETSHCYGIELRGGFFAPMIEKGLKFGDMDEYSYTRKFGNVENSSSVIVAGFITQEKLVITEEGSFKKTDEPIIVHERRGDKNLFECIGEFELRGIPKAQAGTVPIELTLTVKRNNMISVTAKIENGEETTVYWNH